jgi:hypothetical protein
LEFEMAGNGIIDGLRVAPPFDFSGQYDPIDTIHGKE